MPGPGGGSNGGGFGGGSHGGGFGGGSHGGGFGGGGFRGPHRHYGPRRPFFFGGWYHRPYYYGGGGCLGGLVGALVVPIVFVLVFVIALFGSFTTAISNIASGGSVKYDERVMQDYGLARYAEAFADTEAYEENILIVFLVNEEYDGYYVYACVGDDLPLGVRELFGNEYTPFGATVLSTVPDYYEHALSSRLADIMTKMSTKVVAEGSVGDGESNGYSYLVNKSPLALNEATVNGALENFTAKTGINAVIAVDDTESVFGKRIHADDIIIILVMIGLIAFIGFIIFSAVKAKKNEKKYGNPNGRDDYFDENYRF